MLSNGGTRSDLLDAMVAVAAVVFTTSVQQRDGPGIGTFEAFQ